MKLSKTAYAIALACVMTGTTVSLQAQDAQSIVRSEQSAYLLRASDLIGMSVLNHVGQELGEVDDLIIMKDDQAVAHAVLSVGGFLGIGDKLVVVPYSELLIGPENDHLIYDSTEEQLTALPEFTYNEGETWGAAIREKREQMGAAVSEASQRAKEATQAAVEKTKEATATAVEKTKEAASNAAESAKETAQDVKEHPIWDKIAGNWNQFKGHVKQQWGELTNDQLDVIEGKRDVLVGQVQETYGINREEAEQQVDSWADSIQ